MAEILALRHQLAILKRSSKKRPRLGKSDRLLWVWLSRFWPDGRNSLLVVKPETVLAWLRRDFGSIGRGRVTGTALEDPILPKRFEI